MVAGALLALAAAMALLVASLFTAGYGLVWASLAADAVAVTLLAVAVRRRRPAPPG